jgi:hypothetical protein
MHPHPHFAHIFVKFLFGLCFAKTRLIPSMAIHYKTVFLRRCVGGGDNSLHIDNHVDFWASKWSSPLVLVIAR